MSHSIDDAPSSKRGSAAITAQSGYRIISVRLRAAEFDTFSQQLRVLGMTNSLALRIAVRRIAGFIEIGAETRNDLRAITSHIGNIAQTLRELSRVANRDATFDIERFERHRQHFGQEFSALDALLRTILNVSRRREDGRRRLQEVMQGESALENDVIGHPKCLILKQS
ncbi:T-DNA border endonuclease subunit VirD1 [Bradyrhizobium algeriense]|uniref:T-DNA border endonuclease subunit VirD1 n=1 Tax=Bradyrhizobium algeriense TaxID=634784 RepID=UPI000D3CB129|nr:T-DNA border endonuclease subunit VirD1 [Bradyrhizobium algeriense]